jgi:hypothetical protein
VCFKCQPFVTHVTVSDNYRSREPIVEVAGIVRRHSRWVWVYIMVHVCIPAHPFATHETEVTPWWAGHAQAQQAGCCAMQRWHTRACTLHVWSGIDARMALLQLIEQIEVSHTQLCLGSPLWYSFLLCVAPCGCRRLSSDVAAAGRTA